MSPARESDIPPPLARRAHLRRLSRSRAGLTVYIRELEHSLEDSRKRIIYLEAELAKLSSERWAHVRAVLLRLAPDLLKAAEICAADVQPAAYQKPDGRL